MELQALLDEIDSQTQKQLVEYLDICPKDGKNVQQVMEHTLNQQPFIILQSLTCFFL